MSEPKPAKPLNHIILDMIKDKVSELGLIYIKTHSTNWQDKDGAIRIKGLPVWCDIECLMNGDYLNINMELSNKKIEFKLGPIQSPNCDIQKCMNKVFYALEVLNNLRTIGDNAEDIDSKPLSAEILLPIIRKLVKPVTDIPGYLKIHKSGLKCVTVQFDRRLKLNCYDNPRLVWIYVYGTMKNNQVEFKTQEFNKDNFNKMSEDDLTKYLNDTIAIRIAEWKAKHGKETH